MRLKYNRYHIATGLKKVKTKTAVLISTAALAISGGAGLSLITLRSAGAATPNWNLNGTYTFDFEYGGGHYVHDATISGQDTSGNFTISGGYPAGGAYSYAWNGTGTLSGDDVTISVDYTVGAVGTHMDMTGTVASNGKLSGTWTDNFGGTRNGTWASATGTAHNLSSQVIVTPPVGSQGWSTADTRPGGAVNFVVDNTAPGTPNIGALQLTTTSSTAAKAQYLYQTSTPLSEVIELGYSTKQNSAGFADGDASYQLATCLGGFGTPSPTNPTGCIGFTTFVYEPYQNGTVTPGVWQSWDVAAGQMWSSRGYSGGTCVTLAGGGGAPFYTLGNLKTNCPDAVVVAFGVNIGSNNPSYDVEVDLINFNNTVYNFEPYVVATDKEACKKDGWKSLKTATGSSFKNQGDCVSYVVSKKGGNS